jgi:hypothetical protein
LHKLRQKLDGLPSQRAQVTEPSGEHLSGFPVIKVHPWNPDSASKSEQDLGANRAKTRSQRPVVIEAQFENSPEVNTQQASHEEEHTTEPHVMPHREGRDGGVLCANGVKII